MFKLFNFIVVRQTDRHIKANEREKEKMKAKRGLLCMIFLTLKMKATGGKIHDGTLWKVYERARRQKSEWNGKWCDRATAHYKCSQFAQDLASHHILSTYYEGKGAKAKAKSTQSMAPTWVSGKFSWLFRSKILSWKFFFHFTCKFSRLRLFVC